MSGRADAEFGQLQRRVRNAALLLLTLFATGIVGYKLVGGGTHSWLEALYMATITLTTTGLRDVIPTNTPVAEAFTIVYLLFGATAALYTLSTITAFIVEGDLTRGFRRRRMQGTIDGLRDHYVVCGAGQTGSAVLRELVNTQRRCVVIEANHTHVAATERLYPGMPVLHGDCSDDETLTRAGVQRAAGIVICTDDDKVGLVTTVLARQLNPAIRVVARATTERAAGRLRQAGADGVVAPAQIGGMRLASELVRPAVVGFLDQMLRDTNRNLRLEEVEVGAGSPLAGKPVSALHLHDYGSGLLLLALRSASGEYAFNPPGETIVAVGSRLIVMGDPPSVAHLADGAGAPAAG
ncbi:MAG TPA: potassium channel protein [Gemmatimonadaceae bacterium]|nr:potassium channel protein [Gemmatimonadaceae bacterium]